MRQILHRPRRRLPTSHVPVERTACQTIFHHMFRAGVFGGKLMHRFWCLLVAFLGAFVIGFGLVHTLANSHLVQGRHEYIRVCVLPRVGSHGRTHTTCLRASTHFSQLTVGSGMVASLLSLAGNINTIRETQVDIRLFVVQSVYSRVARVAPYRPLERTTRSLF